MAIDNRFYQQYNLVVSIGTGELTPQDIKSLTTKFFVDNPEIKTGFLELHDFRNVESLRISLEEMKDIIWSDNASGRPVASKLAFVARTNFGFGAARQYKAHVESEGREIEVFLDINEAKKWLGIEGVELE